MKKLPNVTRTTLGIRNLLFDEIDSLRAGTTTPQKAGVIARMVTPIVNSVKVEIEFAKHISGKGNAVLSVLNLGSIPPAERGAGPLQEDEKAGHA